MTAFSGLTVVTGGKILQLAEDRIVTHLLMDSRKALAEKGSLFFAMAGQKHDGHNFIQPLYRLGIRQFVVERNIELSQYPHANVLMVGSAKDALQQVAIKHRQSLDLPVVGVTGSNGKTIIKEWLYQLLSPDRTVFKTPGSYNSQIGVPLSVWQIGPHHALAIIEAGISRPGEMEKLQAIIEPTIGVFTNIGSAHNEGFSSIEEKVAEKLKLFPGARTLIYCKDHTQIDEAVRKGGFKGTTFTWGRHPDSDVVIGNKGPRFSVSMNGSTDSLLLPFTDDASVENSFHAIALMIHMGYSLADIERRLANLKTVPMRLELKEGINQCQIIDDTYNNDLIGLQIALDFLNHLHQREKKTLILSDILQSGLDDRELVHAIAEVVNRAGISSFVGIGGLMKAHADHFKVPAVFFDSTETFLAQFNLEQFRDELVLIKGARAFGFERVVRLLQRKIHGTAMEIELGALVHNLNYFRSRLNAGTRVMAMVKAFAYGSGSVEIANLLDYHHVDYLGVAYADEGVELRSNHIRSPIMVMSPSAEAIAQLLKFQLQPEIYSFGILKELLQSLHGEEIRVHVKIDTGMHRLGFDQKDIGELIGILNDNRNLKIASIFSHLAGADEPEHDSFTVEQAGRFEAAANGLSEGLGYRPLYHLLNSAGTLRFPQYQYDMVRLGIGLYGVGAVDESGGLVPVVTLKTYITQVRDVIAGETIGYGRKGKATRRMQVATIAVGYADGFNRAFSDGVGEVLVRGVRVPVVGSVCMDMTMVDVTGLEVREGEEAILYGRDLPLQEIAAKIGTIPYEMLTNTSSRVKRVFWAESI